MADIKIRSVELNGACAMIGQYNVVKITGSETFIGKGYHNDLTIMCYTGYDADDNPVISINEGPNLVIIYEK